MAEMNEQRAREILREAEVLANNVRAGGAIQPEGNVRGVLSAGGVVYCTPGATEAMLDGDFTADELEAIAWWMRHGPAAQGQTKGEG